MSYFDFAAVLASAEVAKSFPKPLKAGPTAASVPLSPEPRPSAPSISPPAAAILRKSAALKPDFGSGTL